MDISASKKSSFIVLLLLAIAGVYLLLNGDLLDRIELDTYHPVSTAQLDSGAFVEQQQSVVPELPDDRDTTPTNPGKTVAISRQKPLHSGSIFVFGRVFSDDGSPISDVLVSEEGRFRSTRTDDYGNYRINLVLPEYKYPVLNFLRSGYHEEKHSLSLEVIKQLAEAKVDMVLSADTESISLHGWIGDQLGHAAVNQKIELRSRGPGNLNNYYYTVFSNAWGEFEFEGIRANTDYKLEVYPTSDYQRLVIYSLKLGGQDDRINIILEQSFLVTLTGRIVNTDAQPIADLDFNVQNIRSKQSPQKLTTDSSGFFTLTNFPAGELKISTKLPNYFKIVGAKLSRDEFQTMTFVIDKGNRFLSGWISDEFGAPVENARVTLDGDISGDGMQTYSLRTRITDQSGTFSFEGIDDIEYMLTVYGKGYQTKEILFANDVQSQNLDVRLTRQTPKP